MTTIISRRNFLRIGCCGVTTLALDGVMSRFGLMNALAAATSDYKALVCVFLFGGNDANNMVIPMDSRYATYQSIRGPLALAQGTLLPIATKSNVPYGLHPGLPEIQSLYNSKAAAIIANVGTLVEPTTRNDYQNVANFPLPNNLFSHSDQQSEWQSGMQDAKSGASGWGGRIADIMQPSGAMLPYGISVAGNSLFVTGQTTTPATLVPGSTGLGLAGSNSSAASVARDAALQQILNFDTGFSLIQSANGILSNGLQVSKVLNQAVSGTSTLKTVFPATDLGNQMQQIARIIQVRQTLGVTRQIFFAAIGGFDTHSAELATQASLYPQVSGALAALYAATQELGVDSDVASFTMSDFSRTFQPSSTDGTDHAWGSHHMVIGTGVVGGDMYGAFPTLALNTGDDANDRGVWIPTTSLAQYFSPLAAWFGIGATDMPTIFPNIGNFSGVPALGFMG